MRMEPTKTISPFNNTTVPLVYLHVVSIFASAIHSVKLRPGAISDELNIALFMCGLVR